MVSTKEFVYPTNSSIRSWGSPPFSVRSPVEPDRAPSTEGITSAPNDEELTALARNGDIDAFDKLIQRHRRMCMRRALLRLHNLNDAEDAFQSACRKAFQCLEQFQGKGTFASWLGRIVENQCLMRIREERNTHFVHLDNPTESKIRLELVDQTTNPEDEVGWGEVVKLLRKVVADAAPLSRRHAASRQQAAPDAGRGRATGRVGAGREVQVIAR